MKPESKPSMYDEPQNQIQYLRLDEDDAELLNKGLKPSKETTGIYDVSFYVERLKTKIVEQMQMN